MRPYMVSNQDINLAEKGLLQLLKWRPLLVTPPIDILKHLLYYANPGQDFTPIVEKTNELIMLAFIE